MPHPLAPTAWLDPLVWTDRLAVLLALGGSLPAFAQTLPPSPMQPTFSRTEGVPVPKTQVSPEYPAAAKEANVGARVILEVMVGAPDRAALGAAVGDVMP